MTQRTAAGRKTDPFEDLLLAEAQLCHDEILEIRRGIRATHQILRDKKIGHGAVVEACQSEFEGISRLIADTTLLAKAAAQLRGQNIRVTRTTEAEVGGGEGVSENANSIPQENVVANDGAAVAAE